MKKIFTFITMAVMAMTAMAEDYTGTLGISVSGAAATETESCISVTQDEDGTYTLTLADPNLATMFGDIVVPGIEGTTENGKLTLKGQTTITVAPIPNTPSMTLPISLDATIDENNLLTADISITDVPLVNTVDVYFLPPTVYTGTLTIMGMPQENQKIEVLKVNDTYNLTLKDFNFMGTLNLGDIPMKGLQNTATEEGTLAFSLEDEITLEGVGAKFGPMPITLEATVDKADVLNATIAITVPQVGDVTATFSSTKSTDINSVETVTTEGNDKVEAIYDLQGRKVTNTNKKGIYILRKADGTTTKVYKK